MYTDENVYGVDENENEIETVGSTHDEQYDLKPNGISNLRAIFLLTNTICGIGLLSISYCFRIGVILNMILSFLLAFFANISFKMLIDVAEKTSIRDYTKLCAHAFGRKWMLAPYITIILTLIGVGILYIQFAYNLFNSFLEYLNAPSLLRNRWILIFLTIIVVNFPLSCLRSISALSYVTFCSMILIVIYIIHNIFYFSKKIEEEHSFDPQNQLKLFDFSRLLISAISIQSSSYTCHPNIFPTLIKLNDKSSKNQFFVLTIVAFLAFIIYMVAGIFGYLTLFDSIQGAVSISYYPKDQVFTKVIQFLYFVLLTLSLPLIHWSVRIGINELFFKTDFTKLRWILIGFGILVFSALIAILVTSISTIFNFIGGITSPFLIYIFPGAYYIKLCSDEQKWKIYLAYFMIFLGVLFIILCLYDSIASLL